MIWSGILGNVDDSFRSVSLAILHHYHFIKQEPENNLGHRKNDYMDANIGLGLAFMFTWIYSAVAFIIAIILLVKKKRNNHISKEQ
ncbi:hypothetical protein [Peribacillus simplex]|uniref:hypothetical protein n=1 Tax=Peribacillus simplex TaxID=1478 RepID=UPI003D2E4D90